MIDQLKEDVVRENKSHAKKLAIEKSAKLEADSTKSDDVTRVDGDTVELAPEAPQSDLHDVTKDEYMNPALLNFEFEVIHTITCSKYAAHTLILLFVL